MNSPDLRNKFLRYFVNLGHILVKSDSLIPSSDPTLLFTSAGMVQFKDNFLGLKKDLKRATSVQKCFRTSDIERVGHTFRHLTFFEMLGNFSFGDYFKQEAILWAWEFLTKECGLEEKKLYITVYKEDEEALEIWSKIVDKKKIYKLGEETNFWRMGDTGPCGPCSEILYDLGEEYGCKRASCSPACDCDRYLEVWNLVFTQFDCQIDGSLKPLIQKNIDTGMGLERLNLVVNNKKTVFETDLFLEIEKELLRYVDIDLSVSKNRNYINAILDHSRGITFVCSEGVLPSNEGRGYVLRKIVRRGLRYAKLLGINGPILYKLVPVVVKIMKEQYPEIELYREKVSLIIKTEEEKFLETLDMGIKILDEIISTNNKIISGKDVFKLYDTYGFPEELVREILAEHNISYNKKEFEDEMQKARELSRNSWRGADTLKTDIYQQFPETEFLGYETYFSEGKILGIIKNDVLVEKSNKDDIVQIIVDKTPFYGESGGQVGDTGWLKIRNVDVVAEVIDTKKFDNRIVHICKILSREIKVGDIILLEINSLRRKDIMRHHTATHLLHKALRMVLGEHATQSGSLVSDTYFRFDFVHYKNLADDEIYKIEEMVNQKIMDCLIVNTEILDIEKAKSKGAVALFEEKYGDKVRVVSIGNEEGTFSVELCGGTHCKNTGEIGMFKIISESSLGTNLRRIEAVCGRNVYKYIKEKDNILRKISEIVNTDVNNLVEKVGKVIKQNKEISMQLDNLKLRLIVCDRDELKKEIKGVDVIVKEVTDIDAGLLRNLSDEIVNRNLKKPAIIILFLKDKNKLSIILRLNKKSIEQEISLEKISETISKEFGIKIGGRKDFLQGGGKIEKNLSEKDLLEIVEKCL